MDCRTPWPLSTTIFAGQTAGAFRPLACPVGSSIVVPSGGSMRARRRADRFMTLSVDAVSDPPDRAGVLPEFAPASVA
jgi:hypothetical protein